jgi:hypothetical protein
MARKPRLELAGALSCAVIGRGEYLKPIKVEDLRNLPEEPPQFGE